MQAEMAIMGASKSKGSSIMKLLAPKSAGGSTVRTKVPALHSRKMEMSARKMDTRKGERK